MLFKGNGKCLMVRSASVYSTMTPRGTQNFRIGVILPALFILLFSTAVTHGNEFLDFNELVPRYEEAVKQNESSIAAHMDLGFVYLALAAVDEAQIEFEEALRLDTMPAEQYYWLGRVDYLRTKFDDAIPSFRAAIELLPTWGEAHAELGLCYYQLHRYDEAEEAFEYALSLLMSSPRRGYKYAPPAVLSKDLDWKNKAAPLSQANISYYLSLISFSRSEFDEAAEYCHQAVSLDPGIAEAHMQLGLVYLQKKDLDAAENSFLEAIRITPKLASAHYQLGLLYFKRGKVQEASASMERSQQINKAEEQLLEQRVGTMRNKKKGPVLSNLGQIYLNEKRIDAAIREYRKALWHEPNLAEAHNGLGFAYAMRGQFEEAIAAQQRALELKPEMAEAYIGLGMVRLKRAEISQDEDDYEAALSAYRKAAVLRPDLPEVFRNIGNIASTLSREKEAETAYLKLSELQPNLPSVHLALGQIYQRKEDYQKATQYYREALKRNPNLIRAHHNLGFIAAHLGNYDEAIKHFEEALNVQSESPDTYYFLAEVYFEQQEFEKSERMYRHSLELEPSFAKASERLAHLYNTLSRTAYLKKDYVSAERSMKQALALQPENSLYQNVLKAIQKAISDEKSLK